MTLLLRAALLLAVCSSSVFAALEFEAHRMIQFDQGHEQHGSRRSTLNLMAGSLSSSDLSQRALVVHMKELTPKIVDAVCSGGLAGALLIVLPADMSGVSGKTLAEWKGYERQFLKAAISVPVYFTFQQPATEEIINPKAGGDGYQLVTTDAEATAISSYQGVNLQSWLLGQGANGEDDSLPTIAIVAHYDTFGVAPSLAVGADDNGSGVVVFLELARLFSKLYRRMSTRGKYNIVFVLTGAGRMNFAGTRHWLERADARLLENIELALCLDTLGQGEGLYLHISKPAKDPEIVKLYDEFRRTSAKMGIPFDLVHKKIDLSDPEVYWQHEQFSRKRVLAATASHKKHATPSLEHGSIFDRHINMTTLKRNTKFVAEVLATHIYGFHGKSLEVFSGSLNVNDEFVSAWQSALSQHARMQPFLSTASKSSPQGRLVDGLEKALDTYTSSLRKETFTPTSSMRIYSVTDVQMSAYKVKPATFDLMLSVAILVYFAGLFFALQGVGPGMAAIKNFLTAKPSSSKPKRKEK